MAENKVRIENHVGDTFYPHTTADVVFTSDGENAEDVMARAEENMDLSRKNTLNLSLAYKKMQQTNANTIITIAMQGDSLTAGNGASSTNVNIPNRIKNFLTAHLARPNQTYHVIDRGVGGDTVKMSQERWSPSGADLAIIMLGTNDYNHGKNNSETMLHYERILMKEIKNNTGVMIVLSPQWGSKDWQNRGTVGAFSDYMANVRGLAAKYNCPILDLYSELRNLDASGFKTGEAVPHIHLSDIGYQAIAMKIIAFIAFQYPDSIRKVTNGSFLGVRPDVDGIRMPSAFYIIDEKSYYPTPSETTAGLGTAIKAEGTEKAFFYAINSDEDNLCFVPSFKFTKSDGTEKLRVEINNINLPLLPSNPFLYGSQTARNTLPAILEVTMGNYPTGHHTSNVTQNLYTSRGKDIVYRTLPTKGWYLVKVIITNCEFHGFDFINKILLDQFLHTYETDWIPITLLNGATNLSTTFPTAYRIVKVGSARIVHLRVNANVSASAFATLPANIIRSGTVMRFPALVNTTPTALVIGGTGNTLSTVAGALTGDFCWSL
ncbi:MAG: SGNH/GDSL hydrolase family protein [Solibacillus sp.]